MKFIFFFVVIGMALATAVVLSLEKRYSATAVLVLELGNTSFDTVTSRLRAVDPAIAQTEVEVLRSRRFAEAVAEQMELFDDPDFSVVPNETPLLERLTTAVRDQVSTLLGQILPRLGGGNSGQAADGVAGANTFRAETPGVEQGGTDGSPPPEITGKDAAEAEQDPELAAAMEALLLREAVIDKLLKAYDVRHAGQSLAIRIEATDTDPDRATNIANTVADYYIEQTLENQRGGIDNAIEFLERRSASSLTRLSTLRTELATLIRLNSLDDTGRTDAMLGELNSLRAMAELEGKQAESDLSERIEQRTEALRQRTRAELDRAQLELALQIERERYAAILERLSDYEAQRDSLTPTARLITYAQPPEEPTQPRTNLALGTSFLVLVCFSFIVVLMREGLDTRIWSEEVAEGATGIRSMGHVPRMPSGLFGGRTELVRHLRKKPYSPFGKEVRALMASTQATSRDDPCKAVMVLSALPNEGKSTLSVAFAICAAQDGLRVLLIDLDVHDHGASRILGVKNSASQVQDVLEDPEMFMAGIRRNVGYLGLDVINFSWKSHFGRKLGYSFATEDEIIKELRLVYDLIIIDTPSYQVAEDAERLTRFADAAILVARWGRTKAEVLRVTASKMLRSGIPLVGTATNAIDVKRSRRLGYGGAYGRGPVYYDQGDAYHA